jgi:hypothetical protein
MACLLFPCSLSHSIGREEHALSPPENRREICSRILYFADACSFDYTFSIGNAKERDQPQPPKNTLQSQYMLPSVVDSIHSIAWQATSTPWDGMPFGDMASRRANFQSHDPAHARSITKPEKGYTCPFSLEKLRIGWFTLLLSQVTISVCLAPRETYAAMCPYALLQSPPSISFKIKGTELIPGSYSVQRLVGPNDGPLKFTVGASLQFSGKECTIMHLFIYRGMWNNEWWTSYYSVCQH